MSNSVVVVVVRVIPLLLALACCLAASSEAYRTFGYDIHHRYSDKVRGFLDGDGLPEKGTLDYYAAMAHRDQLFKARHLATSSPSNSILTFLGTNMTIRVSSLGFLHYAVVSVGTPATQFLVALDTGSDLFWLPCDCTSCARSLNFTSGRTLELNIYSPSASSTSNQMPCNSTRCGPRRGCAIRRNACAYQEVYLSSNTSSTGILVDDVLHMSDEYNPQNAVTAPITLGCGIIQTGDFLDGAAINGLFGLGMDNVSVPSILASTGLTANSFSMCFGPDGIGRIEFGDKGTPSQRSTPFNLGRLHPAYNVTVTQVSVGRNVTDVEFTAIFDSGTSFTYLNDPAYSAVTETFISQVTDSPYQPPRRIIFDYCYELSPTLDWPNIPDLILTMGGGDQLNITEPIIIIPREGGHAYCLAIVKSEDIDIIGQNFMTGYRIVFDREDMVLRWRESDCYDSILSSNGTNGLPINRGNNSTADAPSPSALDPVAIPRNRTRIPAVLPPPPPSGPLSGSNTSAAARLDSVANRLLMIIFSVLLHHFMILSS